MWHLLFSISPPGAPPHKKVQISLALFFTILDEEFPVYQSEREKPEGVYM